MKSVKKVLLTTEEAWNVHSYALCDSPFHPKTKTR